MHVIGAADFTLCQVSMSLSPYKHLGKEWGKDPSIWKAALTASCYSWSVLGSCFYCSSGNCLVPYGKQPGGQAPLEQPLMSEICPRNSLPPPTPPFSSHSSVSHRDYSVSMPMEATPGFEQKTGNSPIGFIYKKTGTICLWGKNPSWCRPSKALHFMCPCNWLFFSLMCHLSVMH